MMKFLPRPEMVLVVSRTKVLVLLDDQLKGTRTKAEDSANGIINISSKARSR